VETLPQARRSGERFIGEISSALETCWRRNPGRRRHGRTFARVWATTLEPASDSGVLASTVVPELLPARAAHRLGAGVELGAVRKLAPFGQRRVLDF
jgi:hypothetical protein